MSDDVDVASEIAEETLANILANRAKPLTGVSAVECEECDCRIPEGRRLALPGIQTCVNCAQLIEDKRAFQKGLYR